MTLDASPADLRDAAAASADAFVDASADAPVDASQPAGQWSSRRPLPTGAIAATAAVLGDEIHLLGGADDYYGNALYRTHLRYSARTDTWSQDPAALPDDGTWGCRAHVYGARLYVVGGWGLPVPVFRVLDPATGSWTTLEAPPAGADYAFVSAIIGDYLYVVGGDAAPELNAPAARYDLINGGWTALSPLPQNLLRGSLAGAAVGSKLYVLNGGSDRGSSILQVYDTITDTWTTGAPLGQRVEAPAAVAVGTDIYFIGGSEQHEPRVTVATVVYSDVNVYDTTTDTWRTAAPIPTPRDYPAAVLFEGRIHVFGGGDGLGYGANAHESYLVGE